LTLSNRAAIGRGMSERVCVGRGMSERAAKGTAMSENDAACHPHTPTTRERTKKIVCMSELECARGTGGTTDTSQNNTHVSKQQTRLKTTDTSQNAAPCFHIPPYMHITLQRERERKGLYV